MGKGQISCREGNTEQQHSPPKGWYELQPCWRKERPNLLPRWPLCIPCRCSNTPGSTPVAHRLTCATGTRVTGAQKGTLEVIEPKALLWHRGS